MRYLFFLPPVFFLLAPFAGQAQEGGALLAHLFDGTSKGVLVAAHRGDWRNAPENSIQGVKNCIALGVDVTEFDLKRTADGQLVILHDETLDRSTTGHGRPEDFTFDSLAHLFLRSGTGHPTHHRIPTFGNMLSAAKGKIIVDIDKGYAYYNDVLRELRAQDMLEQAILNIYGLPYDSICAQHGPVPPALTLQLIVNVSAPNAMALIKSYAAHPRTIVQVIFSSDTVLARLGATGVLWYNALWPEQNGGHDDDRAVEENHAEETWGWLIRHGAAVIQTDRPADLLRYLRGKGLHV